MIRVSDEEELLVAGRALDGLNREARDILGKKFHSSQQKFVPTGTLYAYDTEFSGKMVAFLINQPSRSLAKFLSFPPADGN